MKNFSEFLEKIEKLKQAGGVDLSTTEDLSLAVMNLVSLEEHLFFTGAKTSKKEYYDLSNQVRKMRKKLMQKLLPQTEGEAWCATKHLLATTMRLIEVAQKLRSEGKREESDERFADAYQVYAIFWALQLKLVKVKAVVGAKKKDQPLSLQDLVTKLADCCDE